jgi:2,4-didehydro-3-deoxy-L-rhamnonate hydrolase
MRFVAFYPNGRRARRDVVMGVVLGDKVAAITDIDSFYENIATWTQGAARATGSLDLAQLDLAPPIPFSAKIICAAINYGKHGAEANLDPPEFPNLFARWTSEMVADGDEIPVPDAEPEGLDWEVELAAIVGKTLTNVDVKAADQGMFGYTVGNDVSARYSQVQAMKLQNGQWALGKNPEKSCSLGSFIETADGFDYRGRVLETRLNDEVMQSGNTKEMIFSVGELAAFASRHVTLRPGDLLLTGTPDGVGYAKNPRRMMRPGDSITVSVDGIGSLSNPIVGSSHRG